MSFSTPTSAPSPSSDYCYNDYDDEPGFAAGHGMPPPPPPPPPADDDDDDDSILLRCDIARGLKRGDTRATEWAGDRDAPLFAISFVLEDPTALPRLASEAIWALAHVRSFVEKGEAGGAYLVGGVPGFCLRRQLRRKHVICLDTKTAPIPELTTQLRVYEMRRGAQQQCERYVMLVVRSPLPFSLRLAVYLSCEGRGVDERAGVWSKLAMHVRGGVLPRMRPEALLRTFDETLDWMRSGDADGFTCLFSAHMAVDWMRHHFLRKHGGGGTLGLGDVALDAFLVEPSFVTACATYDAEVDARAAPPNPDAKRKPKPPADAAAAAAEPKPKNFSTSTVDNIPAPFVGRGLPPSLATLEVLTPTRQEAAASLVEFVRHVRTFPESVMLALLQGSMREMLPAGLMDELIRDMRQDKRALTMEEVRNIVMGCGEYQLGRQMLCLGDEGWYVQIAKLLGRLPAEGGEERLRLMRNFVRVSFALAFTRATGSDGYTDDRVAAYGRFMIAQAEPSRAECAALFAQSADAFPDQPAAASPTHAGWRLAMELLLACDRRVWNLRPDNLFLFMQLLTGDLSQCLNFFGSVIDGAFNGIGGTAVVRDGGGSYRTRYMDRATGARVEGDVMSKNNSSGADHTTNCFKQAIDIGEYERELRPERETMLELKRVTETSLIQETCNVLEGYGSDLRVKHVITHTGDRKYSTELKTGGDQQSENCMSAIAWLIPRNTRARTANGFQTTREDPNTKERMRVEYRQVKGGYLILCSNNVRQGARERYHTMLAVSRSVASAAGGVDLGYGAALGHGDEAAASRKRRLALDGRVDPMSMGGDQGLDGVGRGLFFNALGVAVYAAFMQWTGMLGQIREPRTTAALLLTFDAHLALCADLLNPSMASDAARFREVSKTRGVAASLLGISVREAIEAGRREEPQQMAVERACLAFKAEGASAAAAWTMGDTLEHSLRLDFFLLMLLLARKFAAPVVSLDALLAWLNDGQAATCPLAHAFLAGLPEGGRVTQDLQTDWDGGPGTDLPRISAGVYITHATLYLTKLDTPFTPEVRARFCEGIGKKLHKEFSVPLRKGCQIKETDEGADIVRGMLSGSIDRPFAWPSVLMADGVPKAFRSMCVPPEAAVVGEEDPERLALPPLRMFLCDATSARLCVDARWLLLANALGQGQLTQAARFTIVAQLVQRFYQHCVPRQLTAGPDLFLGLPAQVVGAGFVWAPLLPSTRRTLRRPGLEVGTDAPCASKLIEDLGVAAPRYELAAMLGVSERDLPTDCVHYEFPVGVWTPAVAVDNDEPVAIQCDRGGRFWMQRERDAPDARHDITTRTPQQRREGFLGGRITRDLRPLCAFFRPGTVVRSGGVVGPMHGGVYTILPSGARLTALEVEREVLPPNAPLWALRAAADAEEEATWLAGTLESLDVEDLKEGEFAMRVRAAGAHEPPAGVLFGASHGAHAFRECAHRSTPRLVLKAEALRCTPPPAGARVLDALP